jgi:hypothetical protein
METHNSMDKLRKSADQHTAMNVFEDEFLLQNIMHYVGDYQFQFLATVNRSFYQAYTTVFAQNQTYYNDTTMEHAKVCYGCEWNHDSCAAAAKRGHWNVLKWAHENECPWDTQTCANAAEGRHFDVLKWCHENGCPWDAQTCAYVAKHGNLEVLKWCHENGCPWDEHTCDNASENNREHVLRYACENGCPPWNENPGNKKIVYLHGIRIINNRRHFSVWAHYSKYDSDLDSRFE